MPVGEEDCHPTVKKISRPSAGLFTTHDGMVGYPGPHPHKRIEWRDLKNDNARLFCRVGQVGGTCRQDFSHPIVRPRVAFRDAADNLSDYQTNHGLTYRKAPPAWERN
jgi:hypothetical protein